MARLFEATVSTPPHGSRVLLIPFHRQSLYDICTEKESLNATTVSQRRDTVADEVKIVHTGCCHDCGGRCVLKAHVRDGRIERYETDSGEAPQLRACLRGRAYRQRQYSPD